MNISIALLAIAATATVPLHAAEEAGFKSLLDGRTLGQWDGDPRFWKVEHGAIIGQTSADNQPDGKINTFLIYRGDSFDDFELRFKFKVEGFNSGMQYRSLDTGNHHMTGLQADFEAQWHTDASNPSKGKWDQFSGMFFEENGRMFMGQRGDVVIVRANPADPKKSNNEKIGTVGDPAELEKFIKRDDWNDYTIIARGNVFLHLINGHVMSVGIDEDGINSRKSGLLGIQLHAGPPMKIEVKDIRIREMK